MWTARDRDIMRDIYLLVSKHPDPTRDQAYWDGLLQHGSDIWRKYEGDPLMEHMVVSVMQYYEKRLEEKERADEIADEQVEMVFS